MRNKSSRGRPIQSDRFRVVPIRQSEIDIGKLAQALVSIAKDIAEKDPASSPKNIEERAGLPGN